MLSNDPVNPIFLVIVLLGNIGPKFVFQFEGSIDFGSVVVGFSFEDVLIRMVVIVNDGAVVVELGTISITGDEEIDIVGKSSSGTFIEVGQ